MQTKAVISNKAKNTYSSLPLAWSNQMTNDLNIFMVTYSQSNELDQNDPLFTSHCMVTQQWPCPGPRVGSGSELEPETFTHLTHHIIIELRLSPRSKARCLDSPCIVFSVTTSIVTKLSLSCYVIITSSSSPHSGQWSCPMSHLRVSSYRECTPLHPVLSLGALSLI